MNTIFGEGETFYRGRFFWGGRAVAAPARTCCPGEKQLEVRGLRHAAQLLSLWGHVAISPHQVL